MHPAILYEKLPNDVVKCQACAHYCAITKDNVGICGVRYNDDGKLFLAVYGHPSVVNIDPIEKKPLYHFLPGSKIFSLGTIGCNFGCDFCQNWDISQTKIEDLKSQISSLSEEWTPKKIVDYCETNRLPSIAYTYNEPTIFAEYVYDTAKLAKERGIKNVLVSNGYQSRESLNYLAPVIDAINIDLKGWTEEFYQKICKARLSVVKENIKLWKEKGVWVEITTLLIPSRNDKDNELEGMAQFLASVDTEMPWHLSRFFPQYKMTDGEVTTEDVLLRAYEAGKKAGLKYVYIGNLPHLPLRQTGRQAGVPDDNTYCPKCSTKVLERDGMALIKNNFKKGPCPKCNSIIKGIWK